MDLATEEYLNINRCVWAFMCLGTDLGFESRALCSARDRDHRGVHHRANSVCSAPSGHRCGYAWSHGFGAVHC